MNACARGLRLALAQHGGWMARADLGRSMDYSEGRVDDELADLVMAGAVLFNERGRQYRLVGEPLARRALRELLKGSQRAHVLMTPSADKTLMRIGVAVRPAGDSSNVVMAELEMPHHKGEPAAMAAMLRGFAALGAAPPFPQLPPTP